MIVGKGSKLCINICLLMLKINRYAKSIRKCAQLAIVVTSR